MLLYRVLLFFFDYRLTRLLLNSFLLRKLTRILQMKKIVKRNAYSSNNFIVRTILINAGNAFICQCELPRNTRPTQGDIDVFT